MDVSTATGGSGWIGYVAVDDDLATMVRHLVAQTAMPEEDRAAMTVELLSLVPPLAMKDSPRGHGDSSRSRICPR